MISKQEQILKDISTSMVDLNSDAVKAGVNYALEEKIDAQLIIKEGLSTGMENIGNKFSSGEYFLSELIWAAHIMKEAMAILEPYLKATDIIPKGKIVIATVEGDLHDIGKNIAISLLRSAGFEMAAAALAPGYKPWHRFVKHFERSIQVSIKTGKPLDN